MTPGWRWRRWWFGALVIGTTPILVRLAACGPAAAGFWRLAFATPLLALMAGGRGAGEIGGPSRAMVLAGVFFALDLACWHYGIRYTSVANATVLPNLTPVLVTLASMGCSSRNGRGRSSWSAWSPRSPALC
ncbi:MAG: EamA family transporter [Caulobacteraceae bacterium]